MTEQVASSRTADELRHIVKALEQMDVLVSATPEELDWLARRVTERHAAAQDIIYSAEEGEDRVVMIDRGKVRLCKVTEDGREVTLAVLTAGEFFGDLGRHDHAEDCDTFSEAVVDSTLFEVSRSDFVEFVRQAPDTALAVIENMATQLHRRESQIEDLVFRTVSERVASTLIRLADDHGRVGREGVTIDLRLTHKDIAAMVAATRETVTGVLSGFRRQGAIEMNQKHVRIADYGLLRTAAGLN
jgi:CRP/FNR family cyclic AMP-dependent transcriptional regulator